MRGIRRYSPEFGKLVSQILDERGLSLRAVAYKTGIHHSTIGEMRRGVVPSRTLVEEFAEGLGIDPSNKEALLVAAGFEKPVPSDPVQRIAIALNTVGELSDLSKQHILDMVREELEKARREREQERNQG